MDVTTTETAPRTWTEQVVRPGRRAYRARQRPRVEEFCTADSSCGGFLVTRTHDVDVATALVQRHWASTFDGPLPAPVARWVRSVPWDHYSGSDGSWIDAAPSERGALPAVEFRYEETW